MKNLIVMLGCAVVLSGCQSQDYVTARGNEIHYEIRGSGAPWIILLAGAGNDLTSFDSIFSELSKITTVVRYSRAGLGESSYSNRVKGFEDMVDELHLISSALEVPAPFILGAHSFGGLTAKAYASRYPSRVAGVLSMDPSFEDNFEVLEPFDPGVRNEFEAGLEHFLSTYPDHAFTYEFKAMVALYDSPETWRELFDYPATIPHFVITSLKTIDAANSPGRDTKEIMNARAEAQYRSISRSDIHMQVRVSDAGHDVHVDRPRLVIDAFKMLYNLVKDR